MLNTIYKEIPQFEGYYSISEDGEVTNNRKVMKTYIQNSGYASIKFTVNGVKTSHLIHRLVAITWLPNPDNKPMVNHIDGDKSNNSLSNLEWVTCSENHAHAYANGLKTATLSHLGKKHKANPTSKYHNVSFDKARNRWVGSIRNKGATLNPRRFASEIEAAEYVNYLIDLHGLHDRTRNII